MARNPNKPENDPLRPVSLHPKPIRPTPLPVTEKKEEPSGKYQEPVPKRALDETQGAPDRYYHQVSQERRDDLAQLLWGEPDAGGAASRDQIQKRRFPATPPPEPPKRRHTRRTCSFPGLLRVMIPEMSFQPRLFAVRMVDVSPKGCRLETRQLTPDLARTLKGSRRHARLEAVVPSQNKLILNGYIVWAEFSTEQLSYFGLHFEQEIPDLDNFFIAQGIEETDTDSFRLVSPEIDSFPSVTSKSEITVTGVAPGAQSVLVHGSCDTIEVPVQEDKFSVDVILAMNRSNFLSFVSVLGDIRSIPTPICIVNRPGVDDTMSLEKLSLVRELEVSNDGRHMKLNLAGEPMRFFQALRRIEQALQFADHVSLSLEINGDAQKAADTLQILGGKRKSG